MDHYQTKKFNPSSNSSYTDHPSLIHNHKLVKVEPSYVLSVDEEQSSAVESEQSTISRH